MARKSIYGRFLALDRRWLYLLIAVVVIISLLIPPAISIRVTSPVNRFFNVIDTSDPEQPIILSVDTPPSGLPELEPMIVGILRHCFDRGQPVILMSLQLEGVSIAERLVAQVQDEFNEQAEEAGIERRVVMGVDWALLGFRAGFGAVILSLGDNIRRVYHSDLYGNYLDDLPIFEGYQNYDDTAAVISISWSAVPEYWVQFAGGPFGVPILVGCTAVSAPQYYAFLQTDQMAGLLGGLKGAAEYETLVNHPGVASRGMLAQTIVHVLIVLFIILGNIAFFVERLAKRRGTVEEYDEEPDEEPDSEVESDADDEPDEEA